MCTSEVFFFSSSCVNLIFFLSCHVWWWWWWWNTKQQKNRYAENSRKKSIWNKLINQSINLLYNARNVCFCDTMFLLKPKSVLRFYILKFLKNKINLNFPIKFWGHFCRTDLSHVASKAKWGTSRYSSGWYGWPSKWKKSPFLDQFKSAFVPQLGKCTSDRVNWGGTNR